MASYYVNQRPQPNGDHEVHQSTCSYLPTDRTYLGEFTNCRDAVQAAKRYYTKSNGCYWCSRDCHTS